MISVTLREFTSTSYRPSSIVAKYILPFGSVIERALPVSLPGMALLGMARTLPFESIA